MAVKIYMENRETKVCLDGFLWTPHPPTAFRPARGPGGGGGRKPNGRQAEGLPPLGRAAAVGRGVKYEQ